MWKPQEDTYRHGSEPIRYGSVGLSLLAFLVMFAEGGEGVQRRLKGFLFCMFLVNFSDTLLTVVELLKVIEIHFVLIFVTFFIDSIIQNKIFARI